MKLTIDIELSPEIIKEAIEDGYLDKGSPRATAEFSDLLGSVLNFESGEAFDTLGKWDASIDHKEVVEYLNGL